MLDTFEDNLINSMHSSSLVAIECLLVLGKNVLRSGLPISIEALHRRWGHFLRAKAAVFFSGSKPSTDVLITLPPKSRAVSSISSLLDIVSCHSRPSRLVRWPTKDRA